MPDIQEIILTELRDLRKETNEGFAALLQRVSVVETKEDVQVLPSTREGRR